MRSQVDNACRSQHLPREDLESGFLDRSLTQVLWLGGTSNSWTVVKSATISHNTGMWTCLIIGALVTPILNRSSSSWSLARTWPIPTCSMTPPKSAHQWSSMHSIWPTLGHSHPLVHSALSSVTVLQRLLIKHCWGDWYLGHLHGWKEVTANALRTDKYTWRHLGNLLHIPPPEMGLLGGWGWFFPIPDSSCKVLVGCQASATLNPWEAKIRLLAGEWEKCLEVTRAKLRPSCTTQLFKQ